MSGWRPHVPKALLERYGTSAPRYTSYPTALDWRNDVAPADYPALLAKGAASSADVSVYVHIPFCEQLCLYCGCNVVITRDHGRSSPYVQTLVREVNAVADMGLAERPISQLHWGGGTPTFLTAEEMETLFHAFSRGFKWAPDAEIALEVDPRFTTDAQIATLAQLGFNRLSMGVQDFDPRVQKAINRSQTREQTESVLRASRAAGFRSVNIDLIYGLPYQHREQFRRTLEITLALRPERVALFHYAHVPWIRKHQEVMPAEAFPSSDEKMEIFADAVEAFTGAGYEWIGLDHFALPDDELAVARRAGTLNRTFMGYSTGRGRDILPFGVTSIGEVGGAFVQNVHAEAEWRNRVDQNGLAMERGHIFSPDDHLRRDVILSLMCNGRLRKSHVESLHGISFDTMFATELLELQPLADDGLVQLTKDDIVVTALGQMFLRNVALPFDAYFRARRLHGEGPSRTFSRTT